MNPIHISAKKSLSHKTLILCEGKSALMFARNAIKVLGKSYGALAIGGLFPNPHKKNGGGKALEALISVLGLDFECQYEIAEESAGLNYQQVLLGFDADPDGTANAGRVISLIALHWPALLSNGFVTLLRTPTVDPVNGSPTLSLGSIQPATAAKFYAEVKEGHHQVAVQYNHQRDEPELVKAFGDEAISERKRWMESELLNRKQRKEAGDTEPTTDRNASPVTVKTFVLTELLTAFIAKVDRCLPSLKDGQTKCRRKVLHTCFQENDPVVLNAESLAGWVDIVCSYTHAKKSLADTITDMSKAHRYNIPLLGSIGDVGDVATEAATSHYIQVQLSPLTSYLFPPEDNNLNVQQQRGDNQREPVFLSSVIPVVLANGADALSPGYKTKIKPHNPSTLIAKTKKRLKKEVDMVQLTPWLNGIDQEEKGQIFTVILPDETVETFASADLLFDAWYAEESKNRCPKEWLRQLEALEAKMAEMHQNEVPVQQHQQQEQQQQQEQHQQQEQQQQQLLTTTIEFVPDSPPASPLPEMQMDGDDVGAKKESTELPEKRPRLSSFCFDDLDQSMATDDTLQFTSPVAESATASNNSEANGNSSSKPKSNQKYKSLKSVIGQEHLKSLKKRNLQVKGEYDYHLQLDLSRMVMLTSSQFIYMEKTTSKWQVSWLADWAQVNSTFYYDNNFFIYVKFATAATTTECTFCVDEDIDKLESKVKSHIFN